MKKEKLSLELMQDIAQTKNGKCLSLHYINSHSKLKWECANGHQWLATPNKVKNSNRWCPFCQKNKPLSLEDLKSFAKSKNGKCLSTKYINSKFKYEWECNFGHRWFATAVKVKHGTWCPKCCGKNKSIEDMKKLAAIKGGLCLSLEYLGHKEKLKWQCDKNHIWETAPINIISYNSWCPSCAKGKLSLDDMKALAKANDGYCLSDEYINIKTKLKWKCKNNHCWKTTPSVILNGSWCPYCSSGFGENLCREILEEIFNKPFKKQRHKWLRNPKTNQPLELDGYNEELNIAFEYNGMQHYKEVPQFKIDKNALKYLQLKDNLKKELCIKNNIKLITIKYVPKPTKEKLKKIIFQLLNENEIYL